MPRFDPFKPENVYLYATQSALLRIACQQCEQEFLVGVFRGRGAARLINSDRTAIEPEFDDPPAHNYVDDWYCAGNTMTWDPLEVVEVWERPDGHWQRVVALEGAVD